MRRAELCHGLVALVLLAGCAQDDAAPRPAASTDTDSATEPAAAVPETDFERFMLGDLPGPGALVRDPFDDATRPRVVSPPQTTAPSRPRAIPAPALRGIIRSNGRFVALFDRGTAGEGETVRGWTIQAIDERSVTLERRGRTVRRTL